LSRHIPSIDTEADDTKLGDCHETKLFGIAVKVGLVTPLDNCYADNLRSNNLTQVKQMTNEMLARNMIPAPRGKGRWQIGLRNGLRELPLRLHFFVWDKFDEAEQEIAFLARQLLASS
jgi:hypothetical protein